MPRRAARPAISESEIVEALDSALKFPEKTRLIHAWIAKHTK